MLFCFNLCGSKVWGNNFILGYLGVGLVNFIIIIIVYVDLRYELLFYYLEYWCL